MLPISYSSDSSRAIILKSIFNEGTALAIAAFIGACIMPTIGALGGVALTGFSDLLGIPLAFLMMYSLKKMEKKFSPLINLFLSLIVLIGSQFVINAGAWGIYSTISSLPHLSYLEALKFGGIGLGLSLASVIIGNGVKKIFNSIKSQNLSENQLLDNTQT